MIILIASILATGAKVSSKSIPSTSAYPLHTSLDLFLVTCPSSLRLFSKTHFVQVQGWWRYFSAGWRRQNLYMTVVVHAVMKKACSGRKSHMPLIKSLIQIWRLYIDAEMKSALHLILEEHPARIFIGDRCQPLEKTRKMNGFERGPQLAILLSFRP